MSNDSFNQAANWNAPVVEVFAYAGAEAGAKAKMDQMITQIQQMPDDFAAGNMTQLVLISKKVERLQDVKFSSRNTAWIKEMRELHEKRLKVQIDMSLYLGAGDELLRRLGDAAPAQLKGRMTELKSIYRQTDKLLKHVAFAIVRVEQRVNPAAIQAPKGFVC